MLDIFAHIYDTIFPPHESILKLRGESTTNFNRHLEPLTQPNWTALSDYHNPYIKAAITANKFHNSDNAAALLAILLDTWLANESTADTALVPIPLSAARLKSRGFNQVARRLKNIRGAFAINKKYLPLPVTKIILIDDVVTTGATLLEARNALMTGLPKDCQIEVVALAH